ncbi:MAG: tetratricopeptide repeat protein [Phaeodactylibacter sp.]|nr:tetratricopeptide repeat protein [Phaeodactylibacter sp.]
MKGKEENMWELFEDKNYTSADEVPPAERRAFLEYQAFVEAVHRLEKEKIKAELARQKPPAKVRKLTANRIWAAIASAAAILLLIVLSFNHFNYEKRLLARHPSLLDEFTLLGANPPPGETLSSSILTIRQAREAILENQPETALDLLQKVQIESVDRYHAYFTARYELARLYFQMGDPTKAITILQDLVQRPENDFVKEYARALLKDIKRPSFLYF